ncbi:MAG: fumarylacetoacetate hydrolase family protein [Brachybacterium sp.]|nr:fumarylacetoacetate hydrolase family protein [Brachybacterium sp.]
MSVPTSGRVLTAEQVTAVADELAEAARTGGTIPLISSRFPGMTVEDAYAIQHVWQERREATGETVVGRKVGLTSRAMQEATGIDEPDYGVIFADQVIGSGEVVEHARFSNVRVEVELAFQLGEDLAGPDVRAADVLAATAVVAPALEILDAHVELAGRTIADTISDNAALGAMVLGDARIAPGARDLTWIGAKLHVNDEVVESGVSGAVLGDPAASAAWLVNKLAAHGEGLTAGQWVLAGSFTRPVWVSPGDRLRVEYQDLGAVEVRFR